MTGTENTAGKNRLDNLSLDDDRDSFFTQYYAMSDHAQDVLMELPKLDLAEDVWNMARQYYTGTTNDQN